MKYRAAAAAAVVKVENELTITHVCAHHTGPIWDVCMYTDVLKKGCQVS